MAINTENDRRSVVAELPVPDGTINTQDRPQVAWVFSGLYYLIPSPVYDVTVSDAAAYTLTISDTVAYSVTVSDVSRS